MKPGEEGGIEPLYLLRWQRRRIRIAPNMSKATPMIPKGIPRPSLSFSLLVRPVLFTTGAGWDVDVDVGLEVEWDELDAVAGVACEEEADVVVADVLPVGEAVGTAVAGPYCLIK
jgi:hypothetical protein